MKITIEHKEKHSEDIFTPGNIVQSNEVYVLIHFSNDRDNSFSGTSLTETHDWSVGEYHQEWDKEQFTKFVGTIMLEQE